MAGFSYVIIFDFVNMTIRRKNFQRMSQAIDFVNKFKTRGHVIVAYRDDEVLTYKSDVLCCSGVKPLVY